MLLLESLMYYYIYIYIYIGIICFILLKFSVLFHFKALIFLSVFVILTMFYTSISFLLLSFSLFSILLRQHTLKMRKMLLE